MGGRLREFAQKWKSLGLDRFLERGAPIVWASKEAYAEACKKLKRNDGFRGSDKEKARCSREIDSLLKQGVIRRMEASEVLAQHPIFLIPKRNGKVRLIYDCRRLNKFIRHIRFKMEDQYTLKELLQERDYAVTLDLHQAYYLVGMDNRAQRYLSFHFGKEDFAFRALPFGYRDAPRTFTMIMRRVEKKIREMWNIRLISYLDDMIFIHQDQESLRRYTGEIVTFLEGLGFILNRDKCVLEPKQTFHFLGWEWNSETMSVAVTVQRARSLARRCYVWTKAALKGASVQTRWLAALIGEINWLRFAYPEASLYMSKLYRLLVKGVKRKGWLGRVKLSPAISTDLMHWKRVLTLNEWIRLERVQTPEAVLTTDASHVGMGAILRVAKETFHFAKRFPERIQNQTSNYRELCTVLTALTHFEPTLKARRVTVVMIRSDNTSVVCDINRKSAGRNLLPLLTLIMERSKAAKIRIRAEHIPGIRNKAADALSRLEWAGDYSVKEEVLEEVYRTLNWRPEVDAFASPRNYRCPRWFGPGSMIAEDGLTADWRGMKILAHPPIPLILPVLRKLRLERPQCLLLIPGWRNQSWSQVVEELTTRKIIWSSAKAILEEGPGMRRTGSSLPPGPYMAVLINPQTPEE